MENPIKQGNKLIDKYMGNVWDVNHPDYPKYPPMLQECIKSRIDNPPPYYLSWDLLMLVIDKIEKEDCVDFTKLYCEGNNCYEFEINLRLDSDESSFHISSDNKILAIYNCVIQFIEWYNKEHKS